MYRNENPYISNGYKDREDYLKFLAEEYGVPLKEIYTLSGYLGENEDFDGLVNELEDYAVIKDYLPSIEPDDSILTHNRDASGTEPTEMYQGSAGYECPRCLNEQIKPTDNYCIVCGLELRDLRK